MPNYTILVKKTKVSIECKDEDTAKAKAKKMGGKIIHKGCDAGDDENHPHAGRKTTNDEEE